MRLRLWVLAMAVSLGACSDDNLPEVYLLGDFRVLALVADRPQVEAGAAVVITPWLSDLDGKGRPLRYSAQACVDPGVGAGAEPSCDGNPTRLELANDAPILGLSGPNYTGALTSTLALVVPPAEVIFANATDDAKFNGVDYLVVMQFTLASGEQLASAFKRISVSTQSVKNQNPNHDVPTILTGNSALTQLSDQEIEVRVALDSGASESYQEIRSDGVKVTLTEEITTSWFVSDGEFDVALTDDEASTTYTPPATPPTGHDLVMVVVSRDGRGGAVALVKNF